MKIVSTYWVIGTDSGRFNRILDEVKKSIEETRIVIKPVKQGNGVKPIKVGVIKRLLARDWSDEHPMDLDGMRSKPLDGFKTFGTTKAGFEWETGNISSSFRALMKLIKGLLEDQLDIGIHVLPSRPFYNFLTDRVGNISELVPYLDVFGEINVGPEKALVILVVEHDAEDKKAKLIPKGLDGMSLRRRKRRKK